MKVFKKITYLKIILTILFFSSCATVPYTNRSSLILIPISQELSLGEGAFEDLKKNEKIIDKGEQFEMIKRVGQKIAEVANKPDYRWEFLLIDKPDVINAFCLPGGKVAFYTGILPVCAGENGIAVVMGHEIAHAIARHGAERMSHGLLAEMTGILIGNAIDKKSPEHRQAILAAYGLTAQLGVLLPFSRAQEYEADRIGLILMTKAGYDPEEAVKFWERMSSISSGKSIPEFLSTHPCDEKRIRELKKRLQK